MTDTQVAAYSSYLAFAEFFDEIAARAPIYGEAPGSQLEFRRALMRSLAPFTAYERAVAESLIAIEWEIIQKRHMLDALKRKAIAQVLAEVALKYAQAQHERDLDTEWEAFQEKGGTEDTWDSRGFDQEGATKAAEALARDALSHDRDTAEAAFQTLDDIGVDAVLVMGEAHLKLGPKVQQMEDDIRSLERRRREGKKDYDTLQSLSTFTRAEVQ